mgnify:FL=1
MVMWQNIVVITITIALGYLFSYLFYQHIYWPYKKKMILQQVPLDLSELLSTLNLIIATEEKLYDDYIFNTNAPYASMSNSEFENSYRELATRILESVSPNLWDMFELYMTRESIQTYVTEQVQIYLSEKINGPALN